MNLPATIRLGTRADGKPLEYDVVAPASMAVRYDLSALAGPATRHRAAAAAVGLCCPMLARQVRALYSGDVSAFGSAMIDGFDKLVAEHKAQVHPAALIHAGIPLLGELVTGLWSAAEVDAAEDFSDPPAEASTS